MSCIRRLSGRGQCTVGEGIYEEFGYQKAGEKRIGWKLVSGQESEFQVGPFLI